jgi:hypothetical protein
MPFELFTKKRSHPGEVGVSITKGGNFILNAATIEKHVKDCKFARVYWDSDHRKIGIMPVKKKDENSYTINISPRGSVGAFSGSAFLRAHGLLHKETKSYPAQWNEKEGLLEFTLGK